MIRKTKLVTLIISALILSIYLPLFAASSTALDKYIDQAKMTLKSGDANKAAQQFNAILTHKKDAISSHPRQAEVWYYFGLALKKLGKTELARKAVDKARSLKNVSNQSQNKPETNDINSVSVEDKKVAENSNPDISSQEKAGNAYSLASLKNPKAIETYRQGSIYEDQGDIKAAVDFYLKAIKSEPDNIELLSKTGLLLNQLGGVYYNNAQTVLDSLEKLKKDPLSTEERLAQARANIYSDKKNLPKADTILKNMVKEDANNVNLILLLGELKSEEKKYSKAIEFFEKAKKVSPDIAAPFIGIGNAYIGLKNYKKATSVLTEASLRWPENPMPLIGLGKAYMAMENFPEAQLVYNKAYQIFPDNFEINLALLSIYARAYSSRAARHLKKCLAIAPNDPRVAYWQAIYMEIDENLVKAMTNYSWLAYLNSEIGIRARVRLGQIFSGMGTTTYPGNILMQHRPSYSSNYKEVIDKRLAYNYFSEALTMDPGLPEAKQIQSWLDSNEEEIRRNIQFEEHVQSLFRQR